MATAGNAFSQGGDTVPSGAWQISGTLNGGSNGQVMPNSVTLNNGALTSVNAYSYGNFINYHNSSGTITAVGAGNSIGPSTDNIGGNGTLTLNTTSGTDALTISAVLGSPNVNTGSLVKTGAGTVMANNQNNTYTGATTVQGGQLTLSSLATNCGNLTVSNGTLAFNYTGSDWDPSLAKTLSGSGRFVKSGSGMMDVTWNGADVTVNLSQGAVFDVEGGTVRFGYGTGKTTWNGNLAALNIAGGATVNVWDYNNPVYFDALTGSGTLTTNYTNVANSIVMGVAGGSGTFSGLLSNVAGGSLALTKTGAGIETLTAANTYVGTTTIGGGTLQLGSGASSQDGSINSTSSVTDNAALVYNLFGNQNINNYAIGGTGSLVKLGQGMLTLSKSNGYSGGTTLAGGTLQLGNVNVLATGGVTISSGTIDLNNNSPTWSALAGAGRRDHRLQQRRRHEHAHS